MNYFSIANSQIGDHTAEMENVNGNDELYSITIKEEFLN